jgi:hypothetical protein
MSTPFPPHVPARRSDRTCADRKEPSALSDRELTTRLMSPLVRCATSGMDPDSWIPVAKKPHLARRQASRALAICQQCPVRAECVEVSIGSGRGPAWAGTASGADSSKPTGPCCTKPGVQAFRSRRCWDRAVPPPWAR